MTRSLRAIALLALMLAAQLPLSASGANPAASAVSAESVAVARIFEEDFEGGRSLFARGWSVERIGAPEANFRVADGNATSAAEGGAYAAGLDARLLSPALDLRYALRAPVDAPGAPLPPAREGAERADEASAPARENASDAEPARADYSAADPSATTAGFLLRWPPDDAAHEDRLNLSRGPSVAGEIGAGETREGASRVNLTLVHAWEFSPGDGARLEVRERMGDGRWSAWMPLAPTRETHVVVGSVANGTPSRGYDSALASGHGGFTGASDGAVRSMFALDAYAGRVIQAALRVESVAPLAPQSFGWRIDQVAVDAALGPPDVAIEGFGAATDGALARLGVAHEIEAHVRNWGSAPVSGVVVTVTARDERGEPAPEYPHRATLDLRPGELARVPLPTRLLRDAPSNVTIEASLRLPGGARDTNASNDEASTLLRFADASDVELRLEPLAPTVVLRGETIRLRAHVALRGNVPASGDLELWATTTGAPSGVVTRGRVALVGEAPALVGALTPPAPALATDLAWTPAAEGAFLVEARWTAGGVSPTLPIYVGRAPPPVLEEPFMAAVNALRPWGADSTAWLAGWTFDVWNVTRDGAVHRVLPAPPSPSRMLVARANDDLGGAELATASAASREREQGTPPVSETLHVGFAPEPTPPRNGSFGANASYARVYAVAEPFGCLDPDGGSGLPMDPLLCEDPRGRVGVVNLTRADTSAAWSARIDASGTRVGLSEAGFASGGDHAGLLYLVLDGGVSPGAEIETSSLEVTRSNGERVELLAGRRLHPFEQDGLHCCVVGPVSAADALALVRETAPGPAPTQALARYTTSRDLADLLAGATAGPLLLSFEHLASFTWADGAGVRGIVEIETDLALPPEARDVEPRRGIAWSRAFEAATDGWSSVQVPLDGVTHARPRLRLTLEARDPQNLTAPLADCPYLDPHVPCDRAGSWMVDDVRVLQRGGDGTWRTVGTDRLDTSDRWTGATSLTGPSVPSVHARGWTIATTEPSAGRWRLGEGVTRDAEPNATGGVTWSFGADEGAAAGAWSVSRSPRLDVSSLAWPELRFLIRFDFGDGHDADTSSGGAVVALLHPRDGLAPARRMLLVPAAAEDGGAVGYTGDAAAPAFAALSRALRIETPTSATATAFAGSTAGAWREVRVDLVPLRALLATHDVQVEFHAVGARAPVAASWSIDEVRVGEPGPVVDVALTGFAGLPVGASVGRNVSVPIVVNVTNNGRARLPATRVEVAIYDADGTAVYPPQRDDMEWRPANLTLPPAGPGAAPAPAASASVPFALPWVPVAHGSHRIAARVVAAGDERLANDVIERTVLVRDVRGAAIAPPLDGRILAAAATAGEAQTLRLRVQNTGTLPFDARSPLHLEVDVRDASGASALPANVSVDVAALLGRPLAPGEEAHVVVPNVWTPRASGVYRLHAKLRGEQVDAPDLSAFVEVRETLATVAAVDLVAAGRGWSNATRGEPPAMWSFLATDAREGFLSLASPISITRALQVALTLTHRVDLEEAFDGGVIEARLDGGGWHVVPPAGGYPGSLASPNALAPRAQQSFTGTLGGTRVEVFDIASVPAFLDARTLASAGTLADGPSIGGVAERSLGPAPELLHAPHRPAPDAAPPGALGHERRDVLAVDIAVPRGARGDLRVAFDEWRAVGATGNEELPPSAARVEARLLDGRTFASLGLPSDARREGRVEVAFPGLATVAAGATVQMRFEHTEVAARVTDTMGAPNRTMAGFESGILASHGGWAVGHLNVTAVVEGNETSLSAAAHRTWSESGWHLPGRPLALAATAPIAPAADSAWRLTAAGVVWTGNASDAAGWTARAGAAWPGARLIVEADLTPLAGNITLLLRESRALTTLVDARTNATKNASLAFVEISVDDGATWETLSALGGDGRAEHVFDLTRHRGRPALLAFRGELSTLAAAANDSWTIEGLRITGGALRPGDLDVRLRAAADADGRHGTWEIVGLSATMLAHGPGTSVRLSAPGDGPLTQGYRTLVLDVANRGPVPVPASRIHVSVTEPAALGGATREASRPTPALAPGERATISVRGAEMNWYLTAGVPTANVSIRLDPTSQDALPADNVVRTSIGGAHVHERALVEPVALRTLPQHVDLTNKSRGPVAFHAVARNTGEDVATLARSSVVITNGQGAVVASLETPRPATARLLPGEAVNVSWSWRPDQKLDAGEYVARAIVNTSTVRGSVARELVATFTVGGPYLRDEAYFEPFGAAQGQDATRAGWTCEGAGRCVEEVATRFASAPVSLAVGPPDASLGATPRAVVLSPEFPVRGAMAWLRLVVRHALPAGAEAHVDVAPVFENGTRGAWTRVASLSDRSVGYDDGAFVPLDAGLHPVLANASTTGVIVRLDAPRAAPGETAHVLIDDVSITALALALATPPAIPIADAVEKRVRFQIENRGAISDIYTVAFLDARGRAAALPDGWSARIVDVGTGRVVASTADARVAIPVEAPAGVGATLELVLRIPPSGAAGPIRADIPVPIRARSTLLPALDAHATVTFRGAGDARPELEVVAVRVLGEPRVGRALSVEVAVANRGLAAATADLALDANAPAGVAEAPTALLAQRVTLPAGAVRTFSATWMPRHEGEHRLAAVLDAAGLVTEGNESNNRVDRPLDVRGIAAPDLRVRLRLDATRLTAGLPVAYSLEVANVGDVAARGVELTVRAGVTDVLWDGAAPLGDLAAGDTWRREGQWTPVVGGAARVVAAAYARAGAPEVIATLGDNAHATDVDVVEEAVRIDALAGGELRATWRITNAGTGPQSYDLDLDLPQGWSGALTTNATRVSRIRLAYGAAAVVEADLVAPDDARAGETMVALWLAAVDGGAARVATAPTLVPARGRLSVHALPSAGSPDDASLDLLVRNDRNDKAEVALEAIDLPARWELATRTLVVGPFDSSRVRVALRVPQDATPRELPLTLGWAEGDQQGYISTVFRLEPRLEANVSILGVVPAGGEADVTLRIASLANGPIRGTLQLSLPSGYRANVTEAAIDVPAGGASELRIRVAAPADAPAISEARVTVGGREWRVPLHAAPTDLRLDVVAAPQDGGETARIGARVVNAGSAPAPHVVAALRHNGRLVEARPLGDLPPGAVADVEFVFALVADRQTWSISVTTLSGAPDATPEDNARAWTLTAPTGGGAFLVGGLREEVPAPTLGLLVAALAIATILRRRRAL